MVSRDAAKCPYLTKLLSLSTNLFPIQFFSFCISLSTEAFLKLISLNVPAEVLDFVSPLFTASLSFHHQEPRRNFIFILTGLFIFKFLKLLQLKIFSAFRLFQFHLFSFMLCSLQPFLSFCKPSPFPRTTSCFSFSQPLLFPLQLFLHSDYIDAEKLFFTPLQAHQPSESQAHSIQLNSIIVWPGYSLPFHNKGSQGADLQATETIVCCMFSVFVEKEL